MPFAKNSEWKAAKKPLKSTTTHAARSANISVEYDSDKHHRGDRKASEDAIRRNGIEHLGTRVVTLTWGQARNYYEFERVALLVASALGKKFGPGWDAWANRRIELHRLLVQR